MRTRRHPYLTLFILVLLFACDTKEIIVPDPIPDPDPEIYTLPVVVHVIHVGEPVGEGTNLSVKQIESQLRTLNEDFRRKEGTRGYNDHPDGGDAKIEFVLAKTDPQGNPTNGIVRLNAKAFGDTVHYAQFEWYADLSYWNPEHYINIWTEPYPEGLNGLILGFARGPKTDLLGGELFQQGEPVYRDGILVNAAHFGESEIPSKYNFGRTLTHEMGHYLGVLHTWGGGDCEHNDYVEDTPPVDTAFGPTCNGERKMVENYMTFSVDAVMNIFTNDQIFRMHYVLENSPYRTTLLDSPGLK